MNEKFKAPEPNLPGEVLDDEYLLDHALFVWRHEAPLIREARWCLGDGRRVFSALYDRHKQFVNGSLR